MTAPFAAAVVLVLASAGVGITATRMGSDRARERLFDLMVLLFLLALCACLFGLSTLTTTHPPATVGP